jgi:hypothetical protein
MSATSSSGTPAADKSDAAEWRSSWGCHFELGSLSQVVELTTEGAGLDPRADAGCEHEAEVNRCWLGRQLERLKETAERQATD